MMEADEPGRCRRTDGKKGKTWRCKNDVVPNAKYCERHIHRGCNRSRKLVEGCGSNRTASRPSSTSQPPQQPSSHETPQSNSTKNLENLCDVNCNLTPSRSRLGDDAPVTIAASDDVRAYSSDPTSQDKDSTMLGLGIKSTNHLVTATFGGPKSRPSSENIVSAHTVELVDAAYSNDIGKEHTIVIGSSKVPSDSMAATLSNVTCLKIMNKDVDFASSSCAASTTAISMVAETESGDRRSHGSNNGQSIGHDSTSKRTSRIRDIDKLKVNTSLGVHFSPKSVLRDANDHCPNPSVQGCTPLCFYISDSEVQPWRCRRTDGRKWRCRKDVLPNQKYCAMHMHRGAKKQVQHSQLADLPISKRSKSTHPRPNQSLPSKEKYSSLNTDLSICALEISRPTEDDEPSTACGSSDATISDDNTSYGNN